MSAPPGLNETPLSPLAKALASSLGRLYPKTDPWVLLSAALTVDALADGDVCLPLARLARQRPWPDLPWRLPDLGDWLERLERAALVGRPGDYQPLILDQERLYLARYQGYEQRLAQRLVERTQAQDVVDEVALQQSLARLFQSPPEVDPDWQRVAAAQAVLRRLLVISGGPGTGKTSTVVRLLAALLEQPGGSELEIILAAPTGKAAARLAEALRQAKAVLPVAAAVKARLPEQAQTLHRLLGLRGDGPQARHNSANPLPLDVLVVDEASMVDLALMAKLLDALAPQTRLILLGDKDQLSAVEAGAVFAELCGEPGLAPSEAQRLSRVCRQAVPARESGSLVGHSVILLRHSYRFAADSGIGQLAHAVRQGDAATAKRLLRGDAPDLGWQAQPQLSALLARLEAGYQAYLEAAQDGGPEAAWRAFAGFRALAALREGPWGVIGLNLALEERIKRRLGLANRQLWYAGRAIMVRQNDYALGLFNGDIGLCLNAPQGLRVYFPDQERGGWRHFAPARLPSHDSAWVLTVHQSQGSEFDQVLLAFPEQPSGLLSRALLYTAITRARRRVDIWAQAPRLREAILSQRPRASGLAQRLRLPPAGG